MGLFTRERKADGAGSSLLANLVTLANQLRSSPDVAGVVRATATAAAHTFGFNEIAIYLREADQDRFRAHATVGRDEEVDRRILETPVPAEVFGRLLVERFQIGCAYFVDHREYTLPPADDAFFPGADLGPRPDGEWHSDDFLLVPLRDRANRLIGVLDLSDPADRRLPTLQLAKELEVFSTFAASAVENALQYEELQGAGGELERQLAVRHDLLELSGAILSTLDHTAVFEQIADVLKSLVDFDCIDISLVDESTKELVTIFAQDAYAAEIMEFRVPLAEGVAGWVVRHNQAQLVNDMNADPRMVQVPGTEDDERQASILVPLVVVGRVMGVLIIDRLEGRTFEPRELEITQLFANMAAIAIRNARSYKEMQVQAISDGLTGLHNHRHFQETLASEISRCERYEATFCLLMMDVDRFKAVNDTVGHQRGDEVLREVADVLRSCSRESDYIARYGGEEFAMILPHTALDEACQVAERIRVLVRRIQVDGPELTVSMSIGVASYPTSSADKDGMIGVADAALLVAKDLGRNRVCTGVDRSSRPAAAADTPLSALGYRFATHLGYTEQEATALSAALRVVEAADRADRALHAISGNGSGSGGEGEQRSPAYGHLSEAVVYGTERWDGRGYPEGLRGETIPRVARTYAVCRAFAEAGAGGPAALRARGGKQLDPRLVNRFLGFLADEVKEWSPLGVQRTATGRDGA